MTQTLNFPKNFLWGTATSAYQVEGGIKNNDWIKFYDAGRACDHYHRFKEDFDLAKSLGQNAHRFSIEWARIEPEEGKFNQKELEHYQQVVSALGQCQLEPFVTLFHFTLPQWFAKKGGWLNKKAPYYFVRYVQKIVEALGGRVRFWLTINEPMVYVSGSFLRGRWPPQEKSFWKSWKVLQRLVKAHRLAYQTIHQKNREAKVGIAKHMFYFEGSTILRYLANDYFLQKIKKYQDFVGLNYYRPWRVSLKEKLERTDMDWEIYPQGIFHILKDLRKYKVPVYITENGLADARDKKRAKFILEHLAFVWQAIQEGVDVRGYFHWSLLDNFEWTEGFWPRFGLIEVDYKTLQRKIRPSARVYAKICQENKILI